MLKRTSALALLVAAVALTGCGSDAPTSSEAKAAMQATMDQEMAAFVEIAGAKAGEAMRSMLPELKSVEVISCEKTQDENSRCAVKMTVSAQGQSKSENLTVSFAKGADGQWSALK